MYVVLGVERRRRWGIEEKSRILEETMAPGAVVCEIARRHGMSQSLLFSWRRQARQACSEGASGSALLPVEIVTSNAAPSSEAVPEVGSSRCGRRSKAGAGLIEIEIGSGRRVRVDSDFDADALRRVLDVLGAR